MDHIVELLLNYKYVILVPLTIIEGPIVSVIAGMLVALGDLNPFAAYGIIVGGDIFGDSFYYFLGRFGRKIFGGRAGKFLRIKPEKVERAKKLFENHHNKTIILAKLFHGIGFTGLIAAGSLKIPYLRYFLLCLATTLFQAAGFLLLGFFFGHAYLQIGKYLDYFAAGTIVVGLAVGVFFWFKKSAN
ncbi:MAG: hypothetical protein V2A63_00230 [Patescibacteria group bacterium]